MPSSDTAGFFGLDWTVTSGEFVWRDSSPAPAGENRLSQGMSTDTPLERRPCIGIGPAESAMFIPDDNKHNQALYTPSRSCRVCTMVRARG